jgi:hypothetical protein
MFGNASVSQRLLLEALQKGGFCSAELKAVALWFNRRGKPKLTKPTVPRRLHGHKSSVLSLKHHRVLLLGCTNVRIGRRVNFLSN